eukprot:Blabericola_migrator_1__1532@NODE_1402_length_4619_cov_95_278559_g584_i1_p1_GENE_NODE_1402_length_4619_cov_95_278559_g584_i1NODE_1402_length_4619_cov_95_278559_g584_i1_p1_ORF_typecomplete_len502_score64_61Cas_VVA1548/PF09652_10/3_6Cas_VVA1548/PF09652_10/2_5ASH/PF15780_5/6_1ASH/PF15780_5/22DUF19/PF01579_18/0_093DUF19/PF01579_18/3_5e03PTS_2RNA/PF01885_16/3_2_NODE_1402_length_4619_cov_95_278559_g584_i115413046
MSGARYLSRVKNAHITAPSKYVALTILSLEPTLAVKGNSSCFLACFGNKGDANDVRRPRACVSGECPDVLDLESQPLSGPEAHPNYKVFRSLCKEFQDCTQKLDTGSKLPSHLSPLVDHCKKIFLKSCGLYLLDETWEADATGQHFSVKRDPWFLKVMPEQTVALLKKFSPTYRGKEFDDTDMRTFQCHITEYGETKCMEDFQLQVDAANGLLALAEQGDVEKFVKAARKVDACPRLKYRITYARIWDEIQGERARTGLRQDPQLPRRPRIRVSTKPQESSDVADLGAEEVSRLKAKGNFVQFQVLCDELQHSIRKLDTLSNVPPPLLDHCKKLFLKSCGLYLDDETRKANATGRHCSVEPDPWYLKIMPEQTVALLKEFSPTYRGKEFDDDDMRTFQCHIFKYGEDKCVEDLQLQTDAASGLLGLALRGDVENFLLFAKRVDACPRLRYHTTYAKLWDEIQREKARVPPSLCLSDDSESLTTATADSCKAGSSSSRSLLE